jgi:transglutaminase-like putative cysteine protease
MPKFRIHHITRYLYQEPARDSANQIMLYPIVDERQQVINHAIDITGNAAVTVHEDYFGNQVGTFAYARPHNEMMIRSRLTVETMAPALPQDNQPFELQWEELKRVRSQPAFIDVLRPEPFDAIGELEKFVEEQRCTKCTPLQSAKQACRYVFDNFLYKKGITTVETTLDEIWKLKSGVCQDFAHVLLAMLRLLNIPARYVSGYICPGQNELRGEGATHAWVEAWIPFHGWLGLDPTNNCLANESHVRLAVGKNFSDCSPVKGTYRGTSHHTMDVVVSVSYEDGAISDPPGIVAAAPVQRNSFRRHLEMQQQ